MSHKPPWRPFAEAAAKSLTDQREAQRARYVEVAKARRRQRRLDAQQLRTGFTKVKGDP